MRRLALLGAYLLGGGITDLFEALHVSARAGTVVGTFAGGALAGYAAGAIASWSAGLQWRGRRLSHAGQPHAV